VHISDVCTGLWGFRRDAFRRLELEAHGFEIEADMFGECAYRRLRVAEIPIRYRARADAAKLASFRDGLKIGARLIRKWYLNKATSRLANRATASNAGIIEEVDVDEARS